MFTAGRVEYINTKDCKCCGAEIKPNSALWNSLRIYSIWFRVLLLVMRFPSGYSARIKFIGFSWPPRGAKRISPPLVGKIFLKEYEQMPFLAQSLGKLCFGLQLPEFTIPGEHDKTKSLQCLFTHAKHVYSAWLPLELILAKDEQECRLRMSWIYNLFNRSKMVE